MFVLIVLFIIVIIALVKLAGGTQKADVYVTVKSRQTLEQYDAISFFRENSEKLTEAENVIKEKAGSNDEGTYITIFVHTKRLSRPLPQRFQQRYSQVLKTILLSIL